MPDNSLIICPICNFSGTDFKSKHGRKSVACPRCGSFERHRHQYLVFRNLKPRLYIPKISVLHIAPEECIAKFLRKARLYISLDCRIEKGQLVGDLTNLPFENNSFELLWASHVLEHIEKIELALSEIKRVLAPRGIAILDVPIKNKKTKFLKISGKHGHRWKPGLDWFTKYKEVGFRVNVFLPGTKIKRYSILPESCIAVCYK